MVWQVSKYWVPKLSGQRISMIFSVVNDNFNFDFIAVTLTNSISSQSN